MTRRSVFAGSIGLVLGSSAFAGAQTGSGYKLIGQDRGHIAILNKNGEVEWEIECRHNSHDIAVLPNGNFLLHTAPNKIVEVTPENMSEVMSRFPDACSQLGSVTRRDALTFTGSDEVSLTELRRVWMTQQ
jgi:hypothetical protein